MRRQVLTSMRTSNLKCLASPFQKIRRGPKISKWSITDTDTDTDTDTGRAIFKMDVCHPYTSTCSGIKLDETGTHAVIGQAR